MIDESNWFDENSKVKLISSWENFRVDGFIEAIEFTVPEVIQCIQFLWKYKTDHMQNFPNLDLEMGMPIIPRTRPTNDKISIGDEDTVYIEKDSYTVGSIHTHPIGFPTFLSNMDIISLLTDYIETKGTFFFSIALSNTGMTIGILSQKKPLYGEANNLLTQLLNYEQGSDEYLNCLAKASSFLNFFQLEWNSSEEIFGNSFVMNKVVIEICDETKLAPVKDIMDLE